MDDWANLLRELVGIIAERLRVFNYTIVLGAVCKSWRSAIALEGIPSLPPMFPWPILPEKKDEEGIGMDDSANIPRQLLGVIVEQLRVFDDIIVMGAACKSRRSAIALEGTPLLTLKFPWLIFAEKKDEDGDNPSNGNVYKLTLPEISG